METSGGQQKSEGDDLDPDPGCMFRRVAVLRPGINPGIHEIAQVVGDRAGDAIDIGIAAPRAILRHAEQAGRRMVGCEVSEPPETGAGETVALE